MKTVNLTQCSPEWHAHRAAHFNASDAPAMLGVSKYKPRSQLLQELATGITQDVDAATQRLFDDGHRFEALARPLAEAIIGDELSPIVGTEGRLSASFDGITFDESVIFEHKTLNDDIRAVFDTGDAVITLPEQYRAQMEQQLMVSGAERCLFMATKWDGETLVERRFCFYLSDQDMRNRLLQGWTQFSIDLEEYQRKVAAGEIVAHKEKPKAEVTIELPALFVHAKGEITTHNMAEFGNALAAKLAEVRAIALITDQDFSNAKEAAKKFRETAKAIKLSKDAMLAQTDTIGEAARKMDAWAKDLNETALQLEKDVEREDLAKKRLIVADASAAFAAHVAALEAEIKPIRMSVTQPDFAGEIKGKRNYASMQNAVDTALANGKIAADAQAKDYRAKLDWCKEHAAGMSMLFPDLQSLIGMDIEGFKAIILNRIAEHKREEQEREAAIIAKAEADAAAKLESERAAMQAEEERKARAKVEAEQAALRAAMQAEEERKARAKVEAEQAALRAAEEAEALRIQAQEKAAIDKHFADWAAAEARAKVEQSNTPRSEAVMHDGAQPAATSQTEPATPVAGFNPATRARASRAEILEVLSENFGLPEEMMLDWIIAEFAGEIQFESRTLA